MEAAEESAAYRAGPKRKATLPSPRESKLDDERTNARGRAMLRGDAVPS